MTDTLAWALLTLASAVIGWLVMRTVVGVAKGELRRLSS